MRTTAQSDGTRWPLRTAVVPRTALLFCIATLFCLLGCGPAFGQGPDGRAGEGPEGHGGAGRPGGMMGGRAGEEPEGRGGAGRPGGAMGERPGEAPTGSGNEHTPSSGSRNPLQQGPRGRWWDNGRYARTVGLTNDQQRRMDSVFSENRSSLVSGLDNLRKAQSRLDTISKTDHPSESALLTEIQNVAQARADLEKANTHMLLQLRNEMTQDQLNKLEKLK